MTLFAKVSYFKKINGQVPIAPYYRGRYNITLHRNTYLNAELAGKVYSQILKIKKYSNFGAATRLPQRSAFRPSYRNAALVAASKSSSRTILLHKAGFNLKCFGRLVSRRALFYVLYRARHYFKGNNVGDDSVILDYVEKCIAACNSAPSSLLAKFSFYEEDLNASDGADRYLGVLRRKIFVELTKRNINLTELKKRSFSAYNGFWHKRRFFNYT